MSLTSLNQLWSEHKLFGLTVALPTILAIFYFGLIASDVYISESLFIVRNPERQATSSLGLLLNESGFSRNEDDSYSVNNYILSRDALQSLDKKLDIRKVFGDKSIDIFSRFPGLDWDNSFENMHRYYQKMVSVELDSNSSITTMSTRAFSADDAYHINQLLLEMSENLVNQLNERSRQDMIKFASQEVLLAEKKAKAAALNLAQYRNEKSIIDPEKQTSVPLQLIGKLQDEIIIAKTHLAQLQLLTKDNPQIPVLINRIQTLEKEIDSEIEKVAGEKHSLASKAVSYQRLALEREFADKQLTTALASLEMARNNALRQQLYVERIAQPNKPDAAMEPRRIKAILITLVMGLCVWGITTMLVAGIKEHQE